MHRRISGARPSLQVSDGASAVVGNPSAWIATDVMAVLFMAVLVVNYPGEVWALICSNLIMASGYPFLFHYLLSLCTALPPVQALFIETPDSLIPEFLLKLLVANHAVNLAIVASVTWILCRSFGLSVALITAFLWSLNLFFLSAVSISQPEFLQADLLMLTVALCSWAFMRDEVLAKLSLYFLASFVFAWVFLVKYNALAFGGFFLLLLYFDSTTIKIKIAGLVACITVFASVLFGYLWLFHYPSTGSWSFHHDRAWLYVSKLNITFGPNVLDHSPGIAALRWKALTVAIPQEYGGYAYSSLCDSASPEQKQKYRPKVDAILSMTEDELRTYIRDNPPQPGFDFIRTAHPLYWYIGLAGSMCHCAPVLRIHSTASSTERVGVGLLPGRPSAIFSSGK